MSSTMAAELVRVRRLMGDRKGPDYVVPSSLLEELMLDAMDEIARECGAGDIIQTGFATVGPSSVSVTVSSAYPAMRHLKQLVRESDGLPLQKMTYDEILQLRAFGGSEFGPPRNFALVPGPDESIQLEIQPTPATAYTLTGVWEPVPAAVTPVAGTIYLEPTALLALRNRVAARALGSLDADSLVKLGKGERHIAMMERVAENAVMDEWSRMHQGEMQDHVVRVMGRRG